MVKIELTEPQRRELEKAVELAIRVGYSGNAKYNVQVLERIFWKITDKNTLYYTEE